MPVRPEPSAPSKGLTSEKSQFPNSPNAFGSLGEAFARSGRRAEAAQVYYRVLELDPSNANTRAMILKLG